jgi:hypothetical protein
MKAKQEGEELILHLSLPEAEALADFLAWNSDPHIDFEAIKTLRVINQCLRRWKG